MRRECSGPAKAKANSECTSERDIAEANSLEFSLIDLRAASAGWITVSFYRRMNLGKEKTEHASVAAHAQSDETPSRNSGFRPHLEAKHAPKERPMLTDSQEIWIILQLVTLHFVPPDGSKAFGDEHLNPSLRVKEMIALKRNCPQIMKQVEP